MDYTTFAELKLQLCSTPVLTYPGFSQHGISAVLSQIQCGKEKVIAFASRTLTKAERRYSVTRKELLAVVTYIHHFRQFVHAEN